ncbi:MAG: sugar phosphate isomerase/epimerase [Lachnospiraceae bacterium]|nr:sugar phosphate isomerase/epimerase [Lachnospiraceae bacterium]
MPGMRFSVLSGIVHSAADIKGLRDMNEVFQILHDVGYDTVDIGLADHNAPGFILAQEDWQQRADELANTAARLGIKVAQSHLPYAKKGGFDLDPKGKDPAYREYFAEMLRRGYVVCGMLGVPYATVHPNTYLDAVASTEIQCKRNLEYYDEFVEWGIRHGVGTAFENMRPESPTWQFPGRYCQYYRDLIELVDSFDDPMVGICLDTGHANHANMKPDRAVHAFGPRLKNLHINDNHYGCRDEHLLPFMGENDWESFLQALVDIDYQGVLNYEVGMVAKRMPTVLQWEMMKSVHESGRLFCQMYDQIRARSGK